MVSRWTSKVSTEVDTANATDRRVSSIAYIRDPMALSYVFRFLGLSSSVVAGGLLLGVIGAFL